MFFVADSGDGGNDVSMIQAADCGVGIEGKVNVPPQAADTATTVTRHSDPTRWDSLTHISE